MLSKAIKSFSDNKMLSGLWIRAEPFLFPLNKESLSDPFTSVMLTDFSMYDPSDLEHVGWYYIPVQNGMLLFLTAPRSEIFAEAYSLLFSILGAVLLAILVSAIVGLLVGNGFAKPIHALTDIIGQTAKLDLTSSYSGQGFMEQKDEIGQMARGVNEIASRSGEMRSSNEQGYRKFQDAREAVQELVRITGQFRWREE